MTDPAAAAAAAQTDQAPSRNRRLGALGKSAPGMIALAILIGVYLAAFLVPLLYRVSPTATNPLLSLAPPGGHYPLGTDPLGRDELARLFAGGQISLVVGVVSMAVSVGVGTAVGLLAGYVRGPAELVLMRIADAWLAIPALVLILVEVTAFGNSPPVIIGVIGLTYWPQVARILYAETLRLRDHTFVEASRAVGAPPLRIMMRHILPHLMPSMIVTGTLTIAWAILTESALSFLGLGIQPPLASWGNMLQGAQSYVYLDPDLAIFPGLCILLTVLSFNILGNALRDVL